MIDPLSFMAILDEFDARTTDFDENDVFGRLAELANSLDESAVGDELRAELLAMGAPEQWERESNSEFNFENARISPFRIDYWERRAQASTHPFFKWRYAAVAIEARAQLKLRAPSADMRKIAIDNVVIMAKRRFGDISVTRRLGRAYSRAVVLGEIERIAAVIDAILTYEAAIGVDNLPGTWGFAYDILLTGTKRHLSDEQAREVINALQARFDRLGQSITATIDVHILVAVIGRLANYYRKANQNATLAQVLEAYVDRVTAIAETSTKTGDLMESLRAVDCLTRAARTCRDFGRRDLESSLMVLKSEVQAKMPPIPTTCVGEFSIDLELLKARVDELAKAGVKSACEQIILAHVPDKGKIEEEVKRHEKSHPLYSMTPLTMMDASNRDVGAAGNVQNDFLGRTMRCMVDGFPYRAAWLRQFLAEIHRRHNDLADIIVANVHVSPLFDPEHRTIVEKGVAAYFNDDHIVATHLLVPQIETAVRRLAGFLGRPIMWEKRGKGGTNLRMLDDLLRDESVAGVLGDSMSLYLRVLLTDAVGWNVRNVVCHGFIASRAFNWNKSVLVLHAIMLLGLIVPRNGGTEPTSPTV